MADKLTVINAGYTTAYYVNDDFYSAIHENDFTSEIEDLYRGLMSDGKVTEFEDIEMDDDQYDIFEESGAEFAESLTDLLAIINPKEDE